MDYSRIEEVAREIVDALEIYPFQSLESMTGKFNDVNFRWREQDDPENPAKLLTFCLEQLPAFGYNEQEVCDFFANYLHSLCNGYRKMFLDTVFEDCHVH